MSGIILVVSIILIIVLLIIFYVCKRKLESQEVLALCMSVGGLVSAFFILARIILRNVSELVDISQCRIVNKILTYQNSDDFYIFIACIAVMHVYCKNLYSLFVKTGSDQEAR